MKIYGHMLLFSLLNLFMPLGDVTGAHSDGSFGHRLLTELRRLKPLLHHVAGRDYPLDILLLLASMTVALAVE